MNGIEKIKEILAQHRDELRERFRVKEIGMFGSYVRGEEKEGSDISIYVKDILENMERAERYRRYAG